MPLIPLLLSVLDDGGGFVMIEKSIKHQIKCKRVQDIGIQNLL